jgi:thiamine phosphate synthase YjbQ (UPF0047 family)
MAAPLKLALELRPLARYDAINVVARIRELFGDVLSAYRKVLYCSHHTTAGYLEQSVARRLGSQGEHVDPFFQVFQQFFPQHAGYTHDQLHLRRELNPSQRATEPPNADAHLTFIGSGLRNCVTYRHQPGRPVYFMDLDGVYEGRHRSRRTSVIAYDQEETVAETSFEVPVSGHPIDSINLADPRLGMTDHVSSLIRREGVEWGRVDVSLAPDEQASAVTVNEFETLLMRHDLAEVLRNPLRFVARQGKRMIQNPRAVPAKSIGYARYDVVLVMNQLLDELGLSNSTIERIINRIMAVPAERLLQWKRSLSFAIASDDDDLPQLVRGRYQSPILIQWRSSPTHSRTIRLKVVRFH